MKIIDLRNAEKEPKIIYSDGLPGLSGWCGPLGNGPGIANE